MKQLTAILSILTLIACCRSAETFALTGHYSETVATDEVVFLDEFDQKSRIPDPRYWSFVPADSPLWQVHMSGRKREARVRKGRLILEACKEKGQYRCGGIRSLGKVAFGPGHRFEIRARISKCGLGAWPAIWLLPERSTYPGWPEGGEIDIMEHLNSEPFVYQTVHSYFLHHHSTVGTIGDQRTTPLDVSKYHDYAVDLTSEALIFRIDGLEIFRHKNLHLTNEPS